MQSEEQAQPELTVSDTTFINRVTVLSACDTFGGIIQPLNPHFSGFNTVIDVLDEDPDVHWIPNLGFVAIAIAEEEAFPLISANIAAINVAPERTTSTDDERPASSYSLLDRRRYRVIAEPSSIPDVNTPVLFAVASRVYETDDIDPTAIVDSIALRTSDSRALSLSSNEEEVNETITRPHKKKKRKAKFEASERTLKKHHKRDDHDDSGSNIPSRTVMSGRRHSGLRNRS